MSYVLLGHNLHETADHAKGHFKDAYGAAKFVCETEINKDLPLKPTWQASLQGGYILCIEVCAAPFSSTLFEFVTRCANAGMPVKLWVACPENAGSSTFDKELKQARELGIGVAQVAADGSVHEFSRPVALSLFALRRTNLKKVPAKRRDLLKTAEEEFLGGSPDQGCQRVCQDLEAMTRLFARYTFDNNLWKKRTPPTVLLPQFFTTGNWAPMLEKLDEEVDERAVQRKCPSFKKSFIAGARHDTAWRNALSHKPKTMKELRRRDERLRTMFEATRDLLVDWYEVARVLRLD